MEENLEAKNRLGYDSHTFLCLQYTVHLEWDTTMVAGQQTIERHTREIRVPGNDSQSLVRLSITAGVDAILTEDKTGLGAATIPTL